jgi:hypothetical protein
VTGGSGAAEGPLKWFAHFDGSFRVPAGTPKSLAIAAFFTIIQDRLGGLGSTSQRTVYMSLRISLTEEIFENRVSASMTYAMIIPTVGQLISWSGIFRPAPFSWEAWTASVGDVMGGQGLAGLAFDASSDRIASLCTAPLPAGTQSANKPPSANSSATVPTEGCPTGDYGWCGFKTWLEIEQDTQIVSSGKLGSGTSGATSPRQYMLNITSGDDSGGATISGGGLSDSDTSKPTYNCQIRSAGKSYITLSGWAFRIGQVCFPSQRIYGSTEYITTPIILFLGATNDDPPVPLRAVLESIKIDEQRIVGWSTAGCPIYGAWWRKRYVLNSLGVDQAVVLAGIPAPYQAGGADPPIPGIGPPPPGQ